VLSAGETTVRVTGRGRGGRNQEFALAMAEPLAGTDNVVAASAGTDGIDGPTGAAGAIVDGTTMARAAAQGLPSPATVLARNDSYTFFEMLGDLILTGPTATNVGDVQVLLAGE
jgi:hydroxypyruvate reductase